MSRTRYKFHEDNVPYFVTCSVVAWLPAFTRPDAVTIIFDSWRFLQRNDQWQFFAYVVMENHLHFVITAPEYVESVRRFKSFTARKVIALLIQTKQALLLSQLEFYKLKHKTQSEIQFWQEGSHPQALTTDDMVLQKMEYVHNNPVRRGWVDEPWQWRYSSARCYEGREGLLEVVNDWR